MARMSRPWFREERNQWFVQMNGSQVPLGVFSADAEAATVAAFRELLRKAQKSEPPAVADPDEDKELAQIDALANVVARLREVRLRERALTKEVGEVRTLAESAHAIAAATAETVRGNLGYVSLLGYCNRTNRKIPVRTAASYGLRLAAICRDRGIRIGRITDERFGEVNTYPDTLLDEFFSGL